MARDFKETAHTKTNMEEYGKNYDRIFNKPRCVITGVETENKFQNIPVSTDAIKAAKKFQILELGLSLKDALMKLDKDFTKMMKDNAEASCKEQKNTEAR